MCDSRDGTHKMGSAVHRVGIRIVRLAVCWLHDRSKELKGEWIKQKKRVEGEGRLVLRRKSACIFGVSTGRRGNGKQM